MNLVIRQADTKDIPTINSLAKVVFPETYKEILSPEQLDYMMDWMYSPTNLEKQMEEGHVYFIATYDGEECGYVSVSTEGKDLFHLQKIYVLSSFQGKHIGKKLFEHIVEYLKSIHPEPFTLELNVNRNNKAFSFYKRMGMEVARQGDFPIGNGFYMNDYIMSLKVE